MKNLHLLAFAILVIGGLNWLLVGLLQWDIGQIFGGQDMLISRIIYTLVGLAAVYEVVIHNTGLVQRTKEVRTA
ncbi:MAG: DUF378 domain-containing protein [Candidatus Wildermuthbacteria bacterium]|nr:DUF378 domain-containing protein [Candidatus Wildermuthbacteria bacterium]